MSKIFDIDFRKGSLQDSVSSVLPTITGTFNIAQNTKGNCLRYGSTNMSLNYGQIVNYGTSDFTIVLYLHTETSGILFSNGYNPGLACYYHSVNKTLLFYLNSGGATYTIPNILNNKNHCVLFKRQSDEFFYSINGASFISLGTSIKDLTSPTDFKLGTNVGFTSTSIGNKIYGLKIESVAYTESQKNEAYADFLKGKPLAKPKSNFTYPKPISLSNETGLLAAYNMKISNKNQILDISGNGNHLTAYNSPASRKNGVLFNGVNNYASKTGLNIADWTITFRFLYVGNVGAAYHYIIGIQSSVGIFVGGSIIGYWGFYDASTVTSVNTQIAGTYYTITVTKVGTLYNFYRDGEYQTSATKVSRSITDLYVAKRDAGYGNTNCIIEDIRIYNRALSINEIKDYHNQFAKRVNFKEDFDYELGLSIKPKGWIKGTGGFKIEELTTDDAVLTHLKKGSKMLTCTTAGTISFPSKQAYGIWEFDISKTQGNAGIGITFINNKITNTSNNGYTIYINSSEQLDFGRYSSGVFTRLALSTSAYLEDNKIYRVKITRTIAGVFTIYIKGGNYGNVYQLMTVSSGNNPSTDNTHTSSIYCVIAGSYAGDKIGSIKFTEGIEV